MSGHIQFELRDGWELRTWCGERGIEHAMDVARLLHDPAEDAVLTCRRCGEPVFTVVIAEQREYLLNRLVSLEPFVIVEEEF